MKIQLLPLLILFLLPTLTLAVENQTTVTEPITIDTLTSIEGLTFTDYKNWVTQPLLEFGNRTIPVIFPLILLAGILALLYHARGNNFITVLLILYVILMIMLFRKILF